MLTARCWVRNLGKLLGLLALSACGGKSSDPVFVGTLGGTIQGLTSSGLVLELGGANALVVPAGAQEFAFAAALEEGEAYDVRVKTQPDGQTCTVERGQGTMGQRVIKDIAVSCSEEAHGVGGVVSGLSDVESVTVRLNGVPCKVVGSAAFRFTNQIPYLVSYVVTLEQAPAAKNCTIENGTGTMDHADIDRIRVVCTLAAPATPKLTVSATAKQLHFRWGEVGDATSYILYQSLDGSSFARVSGDQDRTGYELPVSVHLYDWLGARYRLDACNSVGCTSSDVIAVDQVMLAAIGKIGALSESAYPWSVALSADGSTLAVGVPGDASGSTQIDGPSDDWSASDSGAVFVFTRVGGEWVRQAYLKASNADTGDRFGAAIALSADGGTLAVGAVHESGRVEGVHVGAAIDNSAESAGAVYVFSRLRSGEWAQQAYVKASSVASQDWFGKAVALSADGNTLAVGVPGDDAPAGSGCQLTAGSVHVYERYGMGWGQQAIVTRTDEFCAPFGERVALSGDGLRLVVGVPWETTQVSGAGGEPTGSYANLSGAAYVFLRSGSEWALEAYLKASNADARDEFGASVALSADGATLAVGAPEESSGSAGVGGTQSDNSAQGTGAVYVFTRTGFTWTQQEYLKASNPDPWDGFGAHLALSGDGRALSVGAARESSSAAGVGGVQTDNSAQQAGAVYSFIRDGATWKQKAYVKSPDAKGFYGDLFGYAIALNQDGSTLAVSGPGSKPVYLY